MWVNFLGQRERQTMNIEVTFDLEAMSAGLNLLFLAHGMGEICH
jgi:hypothetical protein